MARMLKKGNSFKRNTRGMKVRMLCLRARERVEQQDAKKSLLDCIRAREAEDGN